MESPSWVAPSQFFSVQVYSSVFQHVMHDFTMFGGWIGFHLLVQITQIVNMHYPFLLVIICVSDF